MTAHTFTWCRWRFRRGLFIYSALCIRYRGWKGRAWTGHHLLFEPAYVIWADMIDTSDPYTFQYDVEGTPKDMWLPTDAIVMQVSLHSSNAFQHPAQ